MDLSPTLLLKALLLPPGGLILLGLLALLAGRFTSRLLLTTMLALFYLLSTPWGAAQLMRPLETVSPVSGAILRDQGAQALLVLTAGRYNEAPEYGGDTVDSLMLERLRFAVRLHRQSQLPIIVSGGTFREEDRPLAQIAAEVLQREWQVPVLATENESRTTRENAMLSKPVLERLCIDKVALVTHAWHMPRALYAMQRAGVEALPAATGWVSHTLIEPQARDFLPSATALHRSYYALHEQVGMWWYRLREY